MTELDSDLKREVLEAAQISEIPEFGTREYLDMLKVLSGVDPDLADRLASAMREDEPTEIPAGLRRHLARAKRRDATNDLKRKTTQKQSPDGRWVPNKTFSLALIAVACLGGVLMVMSAQNSQTKKQVSNNLLGAAVGLAGKGGANPSDPSLPVPEISANNSSPSDAATIPVSDSKTLFDQVASPKTSGNGVTTPTKTPGAITGGQTPTTTPLPNNGLTQQNTQAISTVKDMSNPEYQLGQTQNPGRSVGSLSRNQDNPFQQIRNSNGNPTGYKTTQTQRKQAAAGATAKAFPKANRIQYSAVKSRQTIGRINTLGARTVSPVVSQNAQATSAEGVATNRVSSNGSTRAGNTVVTNGAPQAAAGVSGTGSSRTSTVAATGTSRPSAVSNTGSGRASTAVTATTTNKGTNAVSASGSSRTPSVTPTVQANRPNATPSQTNATAPSATVGATSSVRTSTTVNTNTRIPTTVVFRPDSTPSNGNNVTNLRANGSSNSQNITPTRSASQPSAPGFNTVYRREITATPATAPSTPNPAPATSSSQTQSQETTSASDVNPSSTAALPASLKPGARIKAQLVTTIYTAETAVAPVVVESLEGLWLGRVTLGSSKRVEMILERLIDKDGVEHAVQGLGFDVNLVQGLACTVELVAPTLAVDLLQSGLTGLSTYLGGQLGAGTTTTTPGGSSSQSRAAPSLLDSVLGTIGGLFKLPEGNQTIVRVAKVEKDTPMIILYGLGAQPSPQPPGSR